MPTLILICGLPGSGKTTLAKQLETERGAIRQCPDERIAQILSDPSNQTSFDDLRAPVEDQIVSEAKELLMQGQDVILEFGFWSREERLAMIEVAHECNANVELYLLNPELDEICQRIAKRNQELPPGTFMVSMKQLHEFDNLFARPKEDEQGLYDRFYINDNGSQMNDPCIELAERLANATDDAEKCAIIDALTQKECTSISPILLGQLDQHSVYIQVSISFCMRELANEEAS